MARRSRRRRFAEGTFAEEQGKLRLRGDNANNGPIFLCYCSIAANRTNSFPLSSPRRRAGRARAPPRHRLHFTLHRPLVGEAAQAEQGGAHHRILHRHRVRKEGGRESGRTEGRIRRCTFKLGVHARSLGFNSMRRGESPANNFKSDCCRQLL